MNSQCPVTPNHERLIVFVAPLAALASRTRLIKFADVYRANGNQIAHFSWTRKGDLAENEPDITTTVIMRGGRYGQGRRLVVHYFIWMVKNFWHMRACSNVTFHALGLESALPAVLWRQLGRPVEVIYDDADRTSLSHPFPSFIKSIIARLERWCAASSDVHIIPGTARYGDGLNSRRTLILRNTPSASSLDKARMVELIPIDSGKFVLYFNGWIGRERGAIAAKQLADRLRDDDRFLLLLAGRLGDVHAARLAELSNVEYLGVLSNSEALAYYRRASLVFSFYDPSVEINRLAEPNKWGDCLSMGVRFLVNTEVETARPYLAAGDALGVGFDDFDGLERLIRNEIASMIDTDGSGELLYDLSEPRVPLFDTTVVSELIPLLGKM